MNQKLIRTIEETGGEVITTPYTDLLKMSLDNVIRRTVYRGEYVTAAQHRLITSCLKLFDDKYYRYFEKYLGPQKTIDPEKPEKNLARFNNITGVPVVTITYDGTNDYKNDVIIPYLQQKAINQNDMDSESLLNLS